MTPKQGFEDKVTIDDLMKKPQKELLANIYQQVLKTNGTVMQNCKDIEELQTEMKDKIGMKLFAVISGIVGMIIIAFNIIDRIGI